MKAFFDKLLGRQPEANQLQPQPLEVNPSSPVQLKRHVGRLVTLYMAQDRDPHRIDVGQEIEQRKLAIKQFGHSAPQNENEARELQQRMGN